MRSALIEPAARAATSLRNRLTLQIFVVMLLSITAVYLYVAPDLSSRVVNSRLNSLAYDARHYSGPLVDGLLKGEDAKNLSILAQGASYQSIAQVAVVEPLVVKGVPVIELLGVADSGPANVRGILLLQTARDAYRQRHLEVGTEVVSSVLYAEAALPVFKDHKVIRVIIYYEAVTAVNQTVSVVRHQILVAGVIALLLTLIGGYLTARWLSLRVKRLEQAAGRVASGEFGRPIAVDSRDELGQLARAFNDMQEQLARLDSARKQFIATASHELRTPVFSLGGFVELLEDEDLDDETRRRFLGHVSEQVERLRKLSVDLLDLSRLESGALELRPEHVDLGELTRSVADEFELALAEADSTLLLKIGAGADADCDAVRLAQILRILIDNALAHAGPNIRVVVSASRANGRARLAVSDNGREGIDPNAMAHVFEPFFTADESHGSGLGLAIASELAGRMSGRLFVSSIPGRTTFELDIPADRQPA